MAWQLERGPTVTQAPRGMVLQVIPMPRHRGDIRKPHDGHPQTNKSSKSKHFEQFEVIGPVVAGHGIHHGQMLYRVSRIIWFLPAQMLPQRAGVYGPSSVETEEGFFPLRIEATVGCEIPTCLAIARRLKPSLRRLRISSASTTAPSGLPIVLPSALARSRPES